MRPSLDLALRARNWFWYWQVRQISGLTNGQLDQKAFGSEGRRRHFERIEQSGSDPDEIPLVDGRTLLKIVDSWDQPTNGQPGPYASATSAFHSMLWTLLTRSDLPDEAFTTYIQEQICVHGWFRASAADVSLFVKFLSKSEPAIIPGCTTAYSAMLHKICNEITPDGMALLIALFREAIQGRHLEEARAIKFTIGGATEFFCTLHGIEGQLRKLIHQLISDRVIHNIWLIEDDWRIACNIQSRSTSTRERVRELKSWVDWYTNRPNISGRGVFGPFPIVPLSPRIEWLLSNRDHFDAIYDNLIELQLMHANFRWSQFPGAAEEAEEIQAEIDEILLGFKPPEEHAAFYSTWPQIQIGFLPQPY